MTSELSDPTEIKVGDTVTVELPGVAEWNVPSIIQTATVTEENRDALIADAAEQVKLGGAKVYVT